MTENKFLNKKTLLIGAALTAAYLIYKTSNAKAKDESGQGSMGGTDDMLGNQGFDIDPNTPVYGVKDAPAKIPTAEDPTVDPTSPFYIDPNPVFPNYPSNPNTPKNNPSGIGSIAADAAITGGAVGLNLILPNVAKGIKGAIDTKYPAKKAVQTVADTPFNKFLKDPYNIGDSKVQTVARNTVSETAKVEEKAGLKIATNVETKAIPKWAKTLKAGANFIPLLDIPIGAGLDTWFSRYESDPTKKIDFGTALKANTAGELAQLGITGAAAGAGTVVPVVGNLAGGVGGFIVGTGADIAATEAVYKAAGKTSLFDSSPSAVATPYTGATQVNSSAVAKTQAANPFSTSGQTLSSTPKQTVAANPIKQVSSTVVAQTVANNPAAKANQSSVPASVPKTIVTNTATGSSQAKVQTPSVVSVIGSKISGVSSTVKTAASSTLNKITSIFKPKSK